MSETQQPRCFHVDTRLTWDNRHTTLLSVTCAICGVRLDPQDGELARLKGEVECQEASILTLGRERGLYQQRAERAEALLAESHIASVSVRGVAEMAETLAQCEKALEEMLAHSWDATTLERKARAALQRIREGQQQ